MRIFAVVQICMALAGCQNSVSGQLPACLLLCSAAGPSQPAATPAPVTTLPTMEEIIVPPGRRQIVIRRYLN